MGEKQTQLEYEEEIKTVKNMRTLVENIRKTLRSEKTKDLLDDMSGFVDEIECYAQNRRDEREEKDENLFEQEELYAKAEADVRRLNVALLRAVEDRDALLAKLRLTDREWSAQGGCSHTDLEV